MEANTINLINLVFDISNKLRGPYRPPQYRKVMLPMTVLRRLDCVLAPTKDKVLQEYDKLIAIGFEGEALHKVLARKESKDRNQALYNISPYTFEKLLADPGIPGTVYISVNLRYPGWVRSELFRHP